MTAFRAALREVLATRDEDEQARLSRIEAEIRPIVEAAATEIERLQLLESAADDRARRIDESATETINRMDAEIVALRAEVASLTEDTKRHARSYAREREVNATLRAERDRASAASADFRAEREAWKTELADQRAEITRLTAELAAANTRRTFKSRAADALADEVDVLIRRKVIDMRDPAADALLSFRDPPTSERSDRLLTLEAELAAARAVPPDVEASKPATVAGLLATEADALLCRWYAAKQDAIGALVDLENLRRPDPDDSWAGGIGRHDPMPGAEKRAADTKERLVAITNKVIAAMTRGTAPAPAPAPPRPRPRPQCPTHGDTVRCYCTTGALHCHDCGHTPPFCTTCEDYHDAAAGCATARGPEVP